MKKLYVLMMTAFFTTSLFAQANGSVVHNIIPEPVLITEKAGSFKLPKTVTLLVPAGAEHKAAADLLQGRLSTAAGRVVVVKNSGKAKIELLLNQVADSEIGDEGYRLSVNKKKVTIRGNSAAGLYYGAQSLVQLFPAEIESKELVKDVAWEIPSLEIVDYPRVGWRGLMFDVVRHFFTVDEMKSFIDEMARFKFNRMHWHLVDDEGWRIEIKSLPKLTEVGAWREPRTGWFGNMDPQPEEGLKKTYGGFYTQDEVRDIVKYAAERHIEIMPEIDVPGHSSAALAAYPELACFPESGDHFVRHGGRFMDWTKHPVEAIYENTINPASDKVYDFLDKVMAEVAELFPFEYIHTGGDEAPFNFWAKSDEVKELMKRGNLKSMPEVQSYFGKRLEKIIISKGKKMMGWDEILEGGINQSTGLMSWRGEKYGIEASQSGHYVVMTPTTYVYLDYMQGDVATEPRVYASLRLNKVYEFNPVPEGADSRYVLGGQANLWTEQIYNYRQVEYMLWPRSLAVAESVWSPVNHKNWNNFIRKTENHFKRFDNKEVKYSPAIYDPIVSVKKENNKYYVTLETEIDGLDIYTSFDNSRPDRFYPKYNAPQEIPYDALQMRIITYRGTEKVGRMMTILTEDLKSRAK